MGRLAGLIVVALLGGCSSDPPSAPKGSAETSDPARVARADPVRPTQASAAPNRRESQFTKLDDSKCKTTYRDEETGDWSGLCPGLGPISLELSSGDLRDDLEIIQGSSSTPLNIPTIVANGAFNSIGDTLEWRGPAGGPPDVLVARVFVSGPDGTADKGRLTVARLGKAPCIVAIVPPVAGQSDKARAIADGRLPACLRS